MNVLFCSLHLGILKVCKTFKMGLGWEFKVEFLNMWKYTNQKKKTICAFGIKLGSSTCHRFIYNSNNLDLGRTCHFLLKIYFMTNKKGYIKMKNFSKLLGKNLIHFQFHQIIVSQLYEQIVPTNKLCLKSFEGKVLTLVKTFSKAA